jgi:uncharacterized membrane protein YfcA
MELIGYIAAFIVGITLGVFGAGGSILTIPVLYYLFRIDAELSTAYSLFIVGISALAGAVPNMVARSISYRTAIVFSIPSLIAVYLTRAYLLPAIPEHVFTVGQTQITKEIALLVLFSLIMIFAAISMIRQRLIPDPADHQIGDMHYPMIIAEGLIIGTITGLVGAGGGFLIIPALVIFGRLPMKTAVGTSLLIIAIKSLIGFMGDIQLGRVMDWNLLLFISIITILGILSGTWLNKFTNSTRLKGAFGWFVLIMGIFILIKELFTEL